MEQVQAGTPFAAGAGEGKEAELRVFPGQPGAEVSPFPEGGKGGVGGEVRVSMEEELAMAALLAHVKQVWWWEKFASIKINRIP